MRRTDIFYTRGHDPAGFGDFRRASNVEGHARQSRPVARHVEREGADGDVVGAIGACVVAAGSQTEGHVGQEGGRGAGELQQHNAQ